MEQRGWSPCIPTPSPLVEVTDSSPTVLSWVMQTNRVGSNETGGSCGDQGLAGMQKPVPQGAAQPCVSASSASWECKLSVAWCSYVLKLDSDFFV